MKLLTLVTLLLATIYMSSCAKKKQECTQHYSWAPASVGLVGFTPAEADTILVTEARSGKDSSWLIAVPRPDSLQGDTLRLVYGNGLIELQIGREYLVELPGAARSYRITGLRTNDAEYTFSAENCPHGQTSYTAPQSALINQEPSSPLVEPRDQSPLPHHRFLLVR